MIAGSYSVSVRSAETGKVELVAQLSESRSSYHIIFIYTVSGLTVSVGHRTIPGNVAMCQVKYVICLDLNKQAKKYNYQMSGQSNILEALLRALLSDLATIGGSMIHGDRRDM